MGGKVEFKTKIILTTVTVGTLFAGGMVLAGVAMTKINGCLRSYDREVAVMVERYKACPDRYKTDCLDESESNALRTSAAMAEKHKQFATAGMAYSMLNLGENAQRMADSCRSHGRGDLADSIMLNVSLRESAIIEIERMAKASPPSSQ